MSIEIRTDDLLSMPPDLAALVLAARQDGARRRAQWLERMHAVLTCPECGTEERRDIRSSRCTACQKQRRRERRREAQQRRRQYKAAAAGDRVKTTEFFQFIIPLEVSCRQCGKRFAPQRTSAQYCSARCRVAAWRERRE
jgi:hypothetical protein